jgi:3-isopropylmalate dehydrogenase
MLLRTSLGLAAEALLVEEAVDLVLAEGARTRDIAGGGPHVSTTEFGDLVRQALNTAGGAA